MKKLETVYIVEDSDIERSMLKDHLAKYGLNLKEYSSGTTCIKEIVLGTVAEPDLVLMDYFLESTFGPSKDGLESLDKLKEVSPNTSVIMMTSVDNPRIIDLAKQKGALDYVVKGVNGFKELDSILAKHFSLKN
jgi:response regulator RpfG family c-di-GMP phosphodiesterase